MATASEIIKNDRLEGQKRRKGWATLVMRLVLVDLNQLFDSMLME